MASFTLSTRYGMNNVLIPKGGPACVEAILDFSNAAEILIDGEEIVSRGQIEYLQGVYIDNADNIDPLSLTMGTTGQRITAAPHTQGYYAILIPNPPKIIANTTQGANQRFRVHFYNVPIQSLVWATQ